MGKKEGERVKEKERVPIGQRNQVEWVGGGVISNDLSSDSDTYFSSSFLLNLESSLLLGFFSFIDK